MNVGRFRAPKTVEDLQLDELVALAREPLQFGGSGVVPASANYRVAQECGSCSFFSEPDLCTMFDAEVEEEYVCDEWSGADA